ncbi:hypothetical protein GCM10009746_14130 [Microbacterium paludicola]
MPHAPYHLRPDEDGHEGWISLAVESMPITTLPANVHALHSPLVWVESLGGRLFRGPNQFREDNGVLYVCVDSEGSYL